MWKIIGYVAGGLLLLVLIFGIGWKIIGKTEGYRAEEQNFYSFDYHPLIGGCARYDSFKKPETKELKQKVKNETKLETKIISSSNPIGNSRNTLPNGRK